MGVARQASPARPDAKVFRRRRAVALAVLAVVAVGAAVLVRSALAGPGGTPLSTAGPASALALEPAAAHVYVVQPGDTLWSIARAARLGGDLRPVVDRLSAEIGQHPLQPGQRLVVPTAGQVAGGG